MRRARRIGALGALGAALALGLGAGCAAPTPSAPRSPADAHARASDGARSGAPPPDGVSEAAKKAASAPDDDVARPEAMTPGAPVLGLGATSDERSERSRAAAHDVETSQRELDRASGDCERACRALASMDRAAGRLCDLTAPPEAHRCEDARNRVYSARDRVRSSCGTCGGSPAVERNAPIPSVR